MDNGTMVEAFKYLNYYQLATNSLVSKRFWNLIRTHRHKLALLDVYYIRMNRSDYYYHNPADTKLFNEKLSPKEYNKWIVRNGYSKHVPFKGRVAGKKNTENVGDIYALDADVYQNPNQSYDNATTALDACVKLEDETWPLFQHFVRLLMDPFIYIRDLEMNPQKEVFSLLAGAMNRDRDRLQCKQLNIRFNNDTRKFVIWIKDHVRCDEFEIFVHSYLNYDNELLDFFLTGAPCTSEIRGNSWHYNPSKVIVALVQKFMGLEKRNKYQLVESIRGDDKGQDVVEELKRNCTEFIAEEEQYEDDFDTRQVIGFINNDIEKKLTLDVRNNIFWSPFLIEISNL